MKNLITRPASISMATLKSEMKQEITRPASISISTNTQYEVEICKHFFTNYCVPLKTKRTNFGKVTIETMLNTYVSGEAFYLALMALNVPMKGNNYHDCTFALKVNPRCTEMALFENWTTAQNRLTEIKEIDLCLRWINSMPKHTTKINYRCSSYGFKHDVERWAGTYISNDSFKTAAKIAGLMTAPSGNLNECYNLNL